MRSLNRLVAVVPWGTLLGSTLLAGMLLTAFPATAHRTSFPRRARIELSSDAVKVVLRQDYDDERTAWLHRDRFDRDSSGDLDDAESEALRDFLTRRAAAPVRLTLNDRPVALHLTASTLEGLERGEGLHHFGLAITLEGSLDVTGPVRLAFSDAGVAAHRRLPVETRLVDWNVSGEPPGRVVEQDGATIVSGVYLAPGEVFRLAVVPAAVRASLR